MIHSPGEYKAGAPIFKDLTLKSYIGEGGFGRVYLVENDIGKQFALKVLYKDIQTEQRGVEAVRKITSNRLVNVLDYGETINGAFCVLMEYLKENFAGVIAEGKLSEAKACHFFVEILRGLKVLEQNGIVHRDIKPSNLFLLEKIIKIGDFGTAKYTSGETTTKTRAIGTLHYCAPECFHNKYDFSVDRWSAAVIFFKMLTGEFPFEGDSYAAIIGSVMMGEPKLNLLQKRFIPFFQQCFAKEADKRFGSAGEMTKALQAALEKKPTRSEEKASKDRDGVVRVVEKKKPNQKKKSPNRSESPVTLRSKPITTDSKEEFQLKDLENDYVDNGDGTITDRKTGLIWEKSGSKDWIMYEKAEEYVKQLNQKKFAGNADWRLPTVDELWSLMEKEKKNGDLYIDPMFDKEQRWCWSSDKRSSGSAWLVGFGNRYVNWYDLGSDNYVRCVRSGQC
jgi:serine/threonine protein kinase